jgi:hypothetical protein
VTNRAAVVVALSLSVVSPIPNARAAWPTDGTLICGEATNQNGSIAISDGAGGAFIAWTDPRNGSNDIYMQRVDGAGNTLWAADGVAVCTATAAQDYATLLSDGAGGVIVAWSDARTVATFYDIYAQRMNSAGVPQWLSNGVVVCTATRGQYYPRMTGDGVGGAIVVWDDDRATNSDVYAARLTAAGATPDGASGVPVATGAATQGGATLIPNGAGGAFLAWTDARNGTFDIYAARFSSGGVVLDPAGIAICQTGGDQMYPATVTDGAGGAIMVWADARIPTIYAQRIDSGGTVQWLANGVAVAGTGTGSVFSRPEVVADGSGGAIVAWWDFFGATSYDIVAQRIDGSGARQWTPNDLKVCALSSEQREPVMVTDHSGGVVLGWRDIRNGGPGYDIFAQRVSSAGSVAWAVNGVAVCQASYDQTSLTASPDASGGALFAWTDKRDFTVTDIYAQRIGSGGAVPTGIGDTAPAFAVLPAWPNPFSGVTTLAVALDTPSDVSVDLFDVAGRHVRHVAFVGMPAGERRFSVDNRDDAGRALASGVYFCRVRAHGTVQTQRLVLVR